MANSILTPLLLLLLTLIFQLSSGDVASDRAECTDQLVGLATCLLYVQGSAKQPTPDCCTGLKEVLKKSPRCLCVLIKDRDDPQLGIKINVTLALAMPDVCGTPANYSECPKLLKLSPNSPEAQIFKQPQKAGQGNPSKSTAAKGSPTSAHESTNSMSSHHHLGVEKVYGVSMSLLLLSLLLVS